MHNFADEVVWITGASSGIGEALAREFAQRNAIVCLSARRQSELQAIADDIIAAGGRAQSYPCDVTSEEELAAVVQNLVGDHGHLHCAIANAG